MKTRIGFVSNSSSTSFCIYGVCQQIDENQENDLEKAGLEIHRSPYGEDMYVGASWYSIQDDETAGQFKNKVKSIIESVLGPVECSTYEESWYDG